MSFLQSEVLVGDQEADNRDDQHLHVERLCERLDKTGVLLSVHLRRNLAEQLGLFSEDVPIVFAQLNQVSEHSFEGLNGLPRTVSCWHADLLHDRCNSLQLVFDEQHRLKVQGYVFRPFLSGCGTHRPLRVARALGLLRELLLAFLNRFFKHVQVVRELFWLQVDNGLVLRSN